MDGRKSVTPPRLLPAGGRAAVAGQLGADLQHAVGHSWRCDGRRRTNQGNLRCGSSVAFSSFALLVVWYIRFLVHSRARSFVYSFFSSCVPSLRSSVFVQSFSRSFCLRPSLVRLLSRLFVFPFVRSLRLLVLIFARSFDRTWTLSWIAFACPLVRLHVSWWTNQSSRCKSSPVNHPPFFFQGLAESIRVFNGRHLGGPSKKAPGFPHGGPGRAGR